MPPPIMHDIRTTYGFIVGSKSYGDADRLLSIFTRDFGLIVASARGIRLEKSKLKGKTQDYSFGKYSLVKGRDFWRLTDAEEARREHVGDLRFCDSATELSVTSSRRIDIALIARIASLLKRFMHGESAHPELFDCVSACGTFLEENKIDDEISATLESLIIARIMHWLGYIGNDRELNGHLQSIVITMQLLESLADKRIIINRHINKALKESHL